MEIVRALDTNKRSPAIYCRAAGCSLPTREQKPYCSEHIERMEYVSKVIAEKEMMEEEQQRVKDRGARGIPAGSPLLNEVLEQISQAPDGLKFDELSRLCGLKYELIRVYAHKLKKDGKVTFKKNSKGTIIVHAK